MKTVSCLNAVTKDQLDTGLTGQIRFRASERNLYAWFFGVQHPIAHVMGYFISILRERIANFEAAAGGRRARGRCAQGVSINDLRKNLTSLNEHMERECASSAARYGISLDASLITGIDPPRGGKRARGHQHRAQPGLLRHQRRPGARRPRIDESKRAVEIETLNAQAEVEPLRGMAETTRRSQAQRPGGAPRPTCEMCDSNSTGAPGSVILEHPK